MKKTVETHSPVVPVLTVAGTGMIGWLALALCPACWPLALVSAPLLWQAAKRSVACDVDTVAAEDADDLAGEWGRTKDPDDRVLEISKTLYSRGAFFDLPMTRTYRYTADDED